MIKIGAFQKLVVAEYWICISYLTPSLFDSSVCFLAVVKNCLVWCRRDRFCYVAGMMLLWIIKKSWPN